MPDAPIPPAAPTPGSERTPSPLNQAQLASLSKTEQICRVALQPDYLAQLTTDDEAPGPDDITEAKIQALLAQCTEARGFSGAAAKATTGRILKTEEEIAAEEALVVIIRAFQARARQKHAATNSAALRDYGIGEDIDVSRAILEQYAQSIYDLTATDQLPKITPARRQELLAALSAFRGSQTGQSSAQSAASSLRTNRDQLLKEITAARLQIQYAAEAEWPSTDPANHPIRVEFQLPATRPFTG